ncbi:MAG: hypothetical protein EHM17_00355 [Verrucomicrobiaceae bacterium]|nr:MAG: hypothetical protein EHM17_17300 [Verrucomicrobiaceae bacterium]RPJ30679.1 MAG: hypothetical protein EHM17_16310 [Verrucomicrobiaceae bacterium]RPJ31514.1 MAG: hypothetical protein EHM17_15400 [Verrucomicrobiaceae bacterium]RPJ33176.1 MAG: hypothetical protein EHM17_11210 [Verrucomicrobiaceae bacterium]RPJ36010.1 MAG: hypothetical protein EHM17_00355 [Verrucomicrobiaceae bacterium]
MKAHELLMFAANTIKGEYPEEQWPDYHVPEMERAAAVLPQLTDNIEKLLKLNAEREETVRKMIRLTLACMPGSKEYVRLNLSSDSYQKKQHTERRKKLIQSLEEYANEGK